FGKYDGPAYGKMELVFTQETGGPIGRRDCKRSRVERRIALVPQGGAIDLIGSRLSRSVYDAASRHTIFGGERGGLDGEFLDGLRRKSHYRARDSDTRVVDAIGQDQSAAQAASAQAQVETRHRRSRGYARVLATDVTRYVGKRHREIEHAAIE